MIFQMNLSPTVSSIASSFIGVFFTIGIAFSPNARLMVVLMVPQFFTSKYRHFKKQGFKGISEQTIYNVPSFIVDM